MRRSTLSKAPSGWARGGRAFGPRGDKDLKAKGKESEGTVQRWEQIGKVRGTCRLRAVRVLYPLLAPMLLQLLLLLTLLPAM